MHFLLDLYEINRARSYESLGCQVSACWNGWHFPGCPINRFLCAWHCLHACDGGGGMTTQMPCFFFGVTGCSLVTLKTETSEFLSIIVFSLYRFSILWGAETRKKRRKTSEFLKDATIVLLQAGLSGITVDVCIFMAYLEAQRGSLNSTLMCCATDMFNWLCGSCGLKMVLLQNNWLPWLVAGETARREDWRASLLPSELDLPWALLLYLV